MKAPAAALVAQTWPPTPPLALGQRFSDISVPGRIEHPRVNGNWFMIDPLETAGVVARKDTAKTAAADVTPVAGDAMEVAA